MTVEIKVVITAVVINIPLTTIILFNSDTSISISSSIKNKLDVIAALADNFQSFFRPRRPDADVARTHIRIQRRRGIRPHPQERVKVGRTVDFKVSGNKYVIRRRDEIAVSRSISAES